MLRTSIAPLALTALCLCSCASAPTGAPAPPPPPPPVCTETNTKTVQIVLKKNSNGVESVCPDPIKVAVDDCIEWKIVRDTDDPSPASIRLIDFVNTASEETPQKRKNDFDIGDYCANQGERCVVPVTWRNGPLVKYRYVVRVRHENQNKDKDPEVEVSCSNCSKEPETTTETEDTKRRKPKSSP